MASVGLKAQRYAAVVSCFSHPQAVPAPTGPHVPARTPSAPRPANRIRGGWLLPLPNGVAALRPYSILAPAAQPIAAQPDAFQLPLLPKREPRSPLARWNLVALPSRYSPEPRKLADRGKTLFLTVMARTQRVELAPLPPARRIAAPGFGIKHGHGVTGGGQAATRHEGAIGQDGALSNDAGLSHNARLAQHHVIGKDGGQRPAASGLLALTAQPTAQAPSTAASCSEPVRVYRPRPDLEINLQAQRPAGGAPKRSNRLVRWSPNLSGGLPPTDLAQRDVAWGGHHLKAMPPRTALRPDPARVQKKGIVQDALRQLPFKFKRGTPWQRLWSMAPADLRWVAMVVPVVVGLAWYSLTPASRRSGEDVPPPEAAAGLTAAAGPAGAGPRSARARATTSPGAATPPAGAVKGASAQARPALPAAGLATPVKQDDGFFADLRQKISRRAAIELSDDFRSGLSAWEGNPGWSDGWSYDQAGFVRPGPLALLRPSVGLQDYTFEFLGKIDQRALSWVYRAKDTRNYYAGKLVMVQAGPLPKVHLVRYRVVNGREEGRKSVPVPEQVRMETMYRVKIDVSGNDFTTSVLGKVVDTYSDGLHTQGGIGFFSARGEEAKVRWVELSHQYDTVGRLCAFLAPPRFASAESGK